MKKFTSAALAAIVLALSLSGCVRKPSEVSEPSESIADSEMSSKTESTESTESAVSTESVESTNSTELVDSTDDPIVIPDDPDNPDDPNEGADNSGLAYPDNKAGRLVKSMLEQKAWSFMELMDAETAPKLLPDLSLDDCEEYCLAFCGMSAQLQYALAVKPKSGSEEKVKGALTSFFENVKNNPDNAFYPMQQASADGAAMGVTEDGYVCVIVHEDGEEIGEKIPG